MTRVFQLDRLSPPGQHVADADGEVGHPFGALAPGLVADTEVVDPRGDREPVRTVGSGEVPPRLVHRPRSPPTRPVRRRATAMSRAPHRSVAPAPADRGRPSSARRHRCRMPLGRCLPWRDGHPAGTDARPSPIEPHHRAHPLPRTVAVAHRRVPVGERLDRAASIKTLGHGSGHAPAAFDMRPGIRRQNVTRARPQRHFVPGRPRLPHPIRGPGSPPRPENLRGIRRSCRRREPRLRDLRDRAYPLRKRATGRSAALGE